MEEEKEIQEKLKESPQSKFIIPLIIIALLLVVGVFFYQYWWLPKKGVEPLERISLRSSLDETWDKYTNYRLGFSMKIPKTTAGVNCEGKEIRIPFKYFENKEDDSVAFYEEYWFERGPHYNPATGKPCKKVSPSIEDLKKHWGELWKIRVRTVNNEDGLNKLVKEFSKTCFLSAHWECSLGKLVPSKQNGVYEVIVKYKYPECHPTSRYKILYSPKKNKAMSLCWGRPCTFWVEKTADSPCYDREMVDSFRFLE